MDLREAAAPPFLAAAIAARKKQKPGRLLFDITFKKGWGQKTQSRKKSEAGTPHSGFGSGQKTESVRFFNLYANF